MKPTALRSPSSEHWEDTFDRVQGAVERVLSAAVRVALTGLSIFMLGAMAALLVWAVVTVFER